MLASALRSLKRWTLDYFFPKNEQGKFNSDDPRELQAELLRLENRNEELKNEMKEFETRSFQDKAEKDKVAQ